VVRRVKNLAQSILWGWELPCTTIERVSSEVKCVIEMGAGR